MPFTYNRAAIMQRAWQSLRDHEAMLAANGGRWFGKPVTLAECVRRAWDAARYEAWSVETGRTGSSLGLSATLASCEFLIETRDAPAAELRRAA